MKPDHWLKWWVNYIHKNTIEQTVDLPEDIIINIIIPYVPESFNLYISQLESIKNIEDKDVMSKKWNELNREYLFHEYGLI